MRKLPINLDSNTASALYLLIDIALSSLSAERGTLESIQKGEQQSELTPEKVKELIEHVELLLEEGKKIAVEVGAIVDELEDDEEEFKPFIKSPD